MARFLVKLILYLVCLLVFCVSVYVIYHEHELRLVTQFRALKRVDPLPKARELAAQGKLCEALDYLDYFREYVYVKNDERVSAFYRQMKEERESYLFRIQDAFSGIWKGKGACTESFLSATVSDFLVVGDVRDLVWGAVGEYYGETRDTFTMALAGVGVLLSGATFASGGGAAPVKGSVSLLKLSKRMGKLSKSLQKSLAGLVKACLRSKSVKPLLPLTESIHRISKVKDLTVSSFMAVISRCRDIKDIKVVEKAFSVFGKQTAKFVELGGNATMDVLRKFAPSRQMGKALDSAIEYGDDGLRLLKKTGPAKFLKYMRIAKYSARTIRTIWNKRLTLLLADLMKMLPMPVIFGVAGLTGLVVAGVPLWQARSWVTRRRHRGAGPDTGLPTRDSGTANNGSSVPL